MMNFKPIRLHVNDGYQRDLQLIRARLDPILMNKLGISAGDIIEISGKRSTMAICLPSFPDDYGNETIRINENIRKNAGIKIGDNVQIKKIIPKNAKIVNVHPLVQTPDLEEFLIVDELKGTPISKGDVISVQYFGKNLSLEIQDIMPKFNSAIISTSTRILFC